MTACKSIDMIRSLISTIMTVNQFMITDYTELLQLVDLAAGQSGVVKMAASKRKGSCAWNYFEKVENDDSLALFQAL